MLRIAILMGCWLSFVAAPTLAQSSAGFGVGVTIGKTVKPPKAKATVAKLTFTWGAAVISVSEARFRNIKRKSRDGAYYWFTAWKGEGQFRIAVSAHTGVIAKVIPA